MRVDIRYLDTFLVVCETGGILKASYQLNITQPAVSYRIKQLENQVNTKLFKVSGRRLILTPAGEKLKNLSLRYLKDLSTIHIDLFETNTEVRETLKIASVAGYGRYILFPILSNLNLENIRIDLTYPLASDVFTGIEEGVYDLGFVYHKKISNLLRYEKIFQYEYVCICNNKLSKTLQDTNVFANYERYPFITYHESDYIFGKWFDSIFGKMPRNTPSLHHFEELEEVIYFIQKGKGITIIPDYLLNSEQWKKGLNVIKPNAKKCTNTVYAVTRIDKEYSKEINKLIKNLA